ncbi:cupin domain-containing protein [Parafilimonas terrae]|uniref:DUF985 domain-containing protein n=1 Tax=Parafilimonas terrae TaxID=1465490 RepID=A0A1I5SL63_9BACT|nr:cupin domain-containing protein [Parafilimonas terrae]SFP71500.1 hypothetical protein SAMN05444277_101822 [Parafilimonas terrae]
MKNAAFYIDHLNLLPHPEGGYYKETYRSKGLIEAGALNDFTGGRHFSTAIYYLLEQGDFSAFHRIKSDECWHYYAGDTLHIYVLHSNGHYECISLGAAIDEGETFQFIVPAYAWFAAECAATASFVLSGCTVAPGFDFADFEMADKTELLQAFPKHAELINRLCR